MAAAEGASSLLASASLGALGGWGAEKGRPEEIVRQQHAKVASHRQLRASSMLDVETLRDDASPIPHDVRLRHEWPSCV